MEIKDLACAVELKEVRGGMRGRSALLDFDFDVVKLANQDAVQVGSNSAYMTFGGIQANTAVHARGGVNSPISGVGAISTYAPSVSLTQGNTNHAANYPLLSGVTF